MKQTTKPRKPKAPVNVPMVFPHPFWERVLTLRDTKPQTFALFSPGFKLSAALAAAGAMLGSPQFWAYCQQPESERTPTHIVSQQRPRADIAPADLRAEIRSWVQLAAALESAA
jgi:hypothetical protein